MALQFPIKLKFSISYFCRNRHIVGIHLQFHSISSSLCQGMHIQTRIIKLHPIRIDRSWVILNQHRLVQQRPARVMSDIGSINVRSIQGLQPTVLMYRDHLHNHPSQKPRSTGKTVLFSRLYRHSDFESLAFFSKMEDKPYTKQSNSTYLFSQF